MDWNVHPGWQRNPGLNECNPFGITGRIWVVPKGILVIQ
jgi:hypothetical protein